MPGIRDILARKRCFAAALFAYSIIILIAIITFGHRMTSVRQLLPMSWTFSDSIESGIVKVIQNVDKKASEYYSEPNNIGIGGGITSKGLKDLTEENMASKMSLFTTFIPSFCETASSGFNYHFYFAYDQSDPLFTKPTFLSIFEATFLDSIIQSCHSNMQVSVQTVHCNHDSKPTWAQNDAMLEAYLSNVEYYYRINDDTKMITKNWVERFIEVLGSYVPVNVGVVGPKHYGGNTLILTYDFVHRTHVDIFGFYYPRLFKDWWGDDWITEVYQPFRSTKHHAVYLEHTMGIRRYDVSKEVELKLGDQVERDKEILQRYINYTRIKDSIKVNGRRVISMSLYGNNPKHTWGAIRNAQIAPIFFPGWKLRIYVTSKSSKAVDIKSWLVPKRILKKLKQLGAEIAYVKTKSIPPVFWRYLVIDDKSVDYFIIRNSHGRLNERDATVVNDWLNHQDLKSDVNSLHCIRDHPDHSNRAIVDGLWGGKRMSIPRLLNKTMGMVLGEFLNSTDSFENTNLASVFLENILWPMVSSYSYCHDSVSCDKYSNIHKFEKERRSSEFVGQEFNEHEEPTSVFSASQNCQGNVALAQSKTQTSAVT